MTYLYKEFSDEMLRFDMVFDAYRKHRLKAGTRWKRGKGTRRCVEGKNKMPDFLRSNENMLELFNLISELL